LGHLQPKQGFTVQLESEITPSRNKYLLLIPYCITDSSFGGDLPEAGVRGASIQSLSEGLLRCFYSHVEGLNAISQQDALAFHKVVSGIFRQTAVIPIRFPTLLNGEQDLRAFLQQQGTQYSAALARLRDSIQMELSISVGKSAAAEPAQPASGRGYMEERRAISKKLADTAEQAQARVQPLLAGWRTRAGNQRDSVRCYGLIPRGAEKDFRDHIQSMAVAEFMQVTVSGPWPCTEFLE